MLVSLALAVLGVSCGFWLGEGMAYRRAKRVLATAKLSKDAAHTDLLEAQEYLQLARTYLAQSKAFDAEAERLHKLSGANLEDARAVLAASKRIRKGPAVA